MARLYNGLDGAISGRIGTMVGYLWKNRACVRTYRTKINYPNTEGQRRERDWFIGMVRFASQAKLALQMGLRDHAAAAGMTEGNYFISRNKAHFHRVEGGVEVDYSRLSLAEGPAADVVFHQARFGEKETVSVSFEKNMLFSRSAGDDKIYVYAYNSSLAEGYLSAPAMRRMKRVDIQLPETWAGSIVHLYGFVVDRQGRPSNTTYICEGMVNHYEERGVYIPVNKAWDDFVELANRANNEPQARGQLMSDRGPVELFDMADNAPPD